MMGDDEHRRCIYNNRIATCQGTEDHISCLLANIPITSSSSSSHNCATVSSVKSEKMKMIMMPFPCNYTHELPTDTTGQADQVYRNSLEQEWDNNIDCESEEGGVDLHPPPTLETSPAIRSGSKRSRAAEVHNLSEKRRRSRINEKMKALQKLIPNSNKTDKASMLDEAIEYLKHLQLQVQMLSMRNGISLHPTYLSSTLQPLQAFSLDSEAARILGLRIPPLSEDLAAENSFSLSNNCAPSYQPSLQHSVTNLANSEIGVVTEPSGSRHQPRGFHITKQMQTSGTEIFSGDAILQQQFVAVQSKRNLADIDSSLTVHASQFGEPSMFLEMNNLKKLENNASIEHSRR